jgi:prepilin-type N-terminal cleavage/methylation domain-containing protein
MKQKGFLFQNGYSLIEILVVIAIAGILAALAVAGLTGLTRKYNVDNQVRGMLADMMNVRIMAMNKNRTHYITLATSCYTAYDDNSPAPDGDGTLTVGSDTVALTSNKALNLSTTKSKEFFPIAWSGDNMMSFNSRGICTTPTTICVYSTVQPLYDCIKVSSTRILLGKLITQGVCSADNCQAK